MKTRTPARCEHCGSLKAGTNPINASGLCRPCAMAAFVEDFTFLRDCGCGWGEIVARLQVSPETIEKRFDRAGRNDLAIAWRAMIGDGGTWKTLGWQSQEIRRQTSTGARQPAHSAPGREREQEQEMAGVAA